MIRAGQDGMVWTDETLRAFLANPRGTVPGTKMAFPGIKDAAKLADLIAYLSIPTRVR